MKKTVLSLALAFMSLASAIALPKVAVLDIAAQSGIDQSVVVPVTETIMEEMVGARAYVVLDRAYVEQVVKEMEFELTGLVGDTQATKAGQFLGADYVIAGKVQTIGDAYFLVAKMIEVRTGVIVAQASEQGEGKLSTLLGMSRLVGRKLVANAPVSPLEPAARTGAVSAAGSATPAAAPERRFKAGFIIPSPAGDANSAVVAAINRIKAAHAAWLDVAVAENTRPETCAAAIEGLVEKERCDIVFSCIGDYAEATEKAAARYPQVLFESSDGRWLEAGAPNLGVFGLYESQFWYLEGVVAGCLSASGKIGVLTESPEGQPWIYRMVNTFALGVRAANAKAQLLVDYRPPDHWGNPDSDVAAAKALVAKGCDFIWGAVYPQVIWALEPLAKAGARIRTYLSDFTYKLAPAVIVSGPLRDWTVLFDPPLLAMKEGRWKRDAVYPYRASRFGGGEEPFNPAFLPELQSKKIKTADRGTLPLLELLELRAMQMESGQFEPYTGPLKDQKGTLRFKADVKATWQEVDAIDWFLDNVKLSPTGK